jgi:hypothetical protein
MNTAVTSLPMQAAPSALRLWVARTGATVWRAFEDAGRARARRHLLDFADQCQALQPELAKELRTAARHTPLA